MNCVDLPIGAVFYPNKADRFHNHKILKHYGGYLSLTHPLFDWADADVNHFSDVTPLPHGETVVYINP